MLEKRNKTFKISPDFSVSPLPRVMRIETSSLCNLRCICCPTGTSPSGNRGNMSEEVFNKIVDEIKTYNGVDVAVLYHGGEPFLNNNIFNMIETLKDIGIPFVKTVSNGMALKEEILPRIIESGLDSIEFSLDGQSPEENNKIRKGCDYNNVVSVIKKLLVMKKQMNYMTPQVHVANMQIPTIEELHDEKGISTPDYLVNEFSEFDGEINFKNTYMIKWPGFDCADQFEIYEESDHENMKLSNYCEQVIELITFRWNGDIVPCCYDITSSYIVGTIMEQPLCDIWNNERYKAIRRSIHRRKFISLCKNCVMINPKHYVVKKESK